MNRTWIACAVVACAGAAATADAHGVFNVEVNAEPPAPRYEQVPAPRPGYAWSAGYWGWDGRNHVWNKGHWIKERQGQAWVSEHWEQRNGHHVLAPGRWEASKNFQDMSRREQKEVIYPTRPADQMPRDNN